ncbi:DUF397 domain-containing protein [Stackebrandtia sp.]
MTPQTSTSIAKVASSWRKSTRSPSQGGSCVEVSLRRKNPRKPNDETQH